MNSRDQHDAGQKLLPQRGLGKRKKMGCIVNTYDFQQNFQGEFFNNIWNYSLLSKLNPLLDHLLTFQFTKKIIQMNECISKAKSKMLLNVSTMKIAYNSNFSVRKSRPDFNFR